MFVLEAGVYRPSDSWDAVQPADGSEIVAALGRVIGMQVEEALRDVDRRELRANMVVTTMLDMPFTSGWMRWRDLQRSIRAHTESCPETLLSAYECASWGFALRYARSLERPGYRLPGLVAITILDINVLNLSHWHENLNWGRSGYGIGSVILRCTGNDTIDCNVAKGANGFGEFCIDLRNRMLADPELIVTPPFFTPNISALYDRLLPQERLLPNRVDTWGHSFGADPWIALIEERAIAPEPGTRRYLATSVSLNGYWCAAELKLGAGDNFRLLDRLPSPTGREPA